MKIKTFNKLALAVAFTSLSSFANADHSPVGSWTLGYDWYCDGSYSKTTMTFNADGTFGIGTATNSGKWWEDHSTLTFTFTGGTTYTAYHVNKSMTGVQHTTGTLSGCWYAHPNDGFNYDLLDTAPNDGINADGAVNGVQNSTSNIEPGVEG